MTKAEDQVMSVAAASIISRYIFLKEMKNMGDKLNKKIIFGAGPQVDELAKSIVNEKGFDELKYYVKLNFKNTSKIKGE